MKTRVLIVDDEAPIQRFLRPPCRLPAMRC